MILPQNQGLLHFVVTTYSESSVCDHNSRTYNYFIFWTPGTIAQTSFNGISLCMCRNLYSLTLEPREVHWHKGHHFKNHVLWSLYVERWRCIFLVNKKYSATSEKTCHVVLRHLSLEQVSSNDSCTGYISCRLSSHLYFLTLWNECRVIYSLRWWFMKIKSAS